MRWLSVVEESFAHTAVKLEIGTLKAKLIGKATRNCPSLCLPTKQATHHIAPHPLYKASS